MTTRETLASIVARRKDHAFLIDAGTGREITYGEFHSQACAVAAELRRRGVLKGDRVGVSVPNCCELAVVYFACIYLGAVIVPINPALSKSEIEFVLTNCKPTLLIASSANAKALRELHPNVVGLVTGSDAGREPQVSDEMVIRSLANAEKFVPLEAGGPDDLIVIMYTSGTSARPKGLAHKRDRMFRNATAFAGAQGINEDSRFYLTLSMAYMGGFYNLLILPFLCGASVVVDHVFDARSSFSFWEKAKKNQVNALWMAPTVLSILLRMDRGRTGEEFCRSSIRRAFVGFAPLPLKVKAEFEMRYGVSLIENYGLSETLFVTARSYPAQENLGYVGEALPGVALRVISDTGDLVTTGLDGEVQIQTPDLMAGYLDGEGRLLETNAFEWFPTGDVGRMTPQGSLSITGRKKDIIIRGGVNISPAAIEEVLMKIEGIAEVAVVSVPQWRFYGVATLSQCFRKT